VSAATIEQAAVDLDEYARRVVADWPPLTPEQAEKVAQILRTGAR
jgi:hypothetical protein